MQVDTAQTFAGPRLSSADALPRVKSEGLIRATRLLNYNIATLLDFPEAAAIVRSHFRHHFHAQAGSLTQALRECNCYRAEILDAVFRTPRHMLVRGTGSPISYWNGVNTIEGTVALTPPWLSAYAAERLRVGPGKRVLVLGYGYGYISLIFSALVGSSGEVVAIELDEELVRFGQDLLRFLEVKNVRLIAGNALDLPRSLGSFDAVWPTLSVEQIPPDWWAALNDAGVLAAFIPLTEQEFSSNDQLRNEHGSYSAYRQAKWWLSLKLVFASAPTPEAPSHSMYGLFNPPMQSDASDSVDISHWYESTLKMESRLLQFLAQ